MVQNFLKIIIWSNEAIKKKKLQIVFKLNLNKISRGRYKSEEQKCTLENINLLYESREVILILFNDYFSIAS